MTCLSSHSQNTAEPGSRLRLQASEPILLVLNLWALKSEFRGLEQGTQEAAPQGAMLGS